MREYKVMVKLDGKWYRASAYTLRQHKPFTSLESAQAYLEEYAEWCKGREEYENPEFKIMSREVGEWK